MRLERYSRIANCRLGGNNYSNNSILFMSRLIGFVLII